MPFNQFVPRNFTPDSVEMYAPMTSGVYGISNAREWIYIGETSNIQDSLLTHLQDRQASIQKREPTGFVFEVCDEAHRSARQNRLVLEYGPTCNRQTSGRSQ
jgi:predicted GIY-YIG superfamily endonuclease